ncbi:MAG: UDP-2,3-diacylglucosamine diphosphatase LpxI, partial [Candidatus Omnitrophica bacterium]|nr:UDP-2,3-diacylglucosamine diphosphatase LpxI [Candidatus Omnitrophota bacterium]
MNKIGLIAGNRQFPLLFSAAAKKNNYYVVAIAIKGDTSTWISRYADKVYWLGLREFGRIFDIFKQEGITKVIMAGQISPRRLFSREVEADSQLKGLLDSLKDKKADTIFGAIAGKLKDNGLELMDSTIFIKDLLPSKGVLTELEPPPELWQDVNFGLELAKAVAGLDIGQSVAVKDKAVVAV